MAQNSFSIDDVLGQPSSPQKASPTSGGSFSIDDVLGGSTKGPSDQKSFGSPSMSDWKYWTDLGHEAVDFGKRVTDYKNSPLTGNLQKPIGQNIQEGTQYFAQHDMVMQLYTAAKNGSLEKWLTSPWHLAEDMKKLPSNVAGAFTSLVNDAQENPGGFAYNLIKGVLQSPEQLLIGGGVSGSLLKRAAVSGGANAALSGLGDVAGQLATKGDVDVDEAQKAATQGLALGALTGAVFGKRGGSKAAKAGEADRKVYDQDAPEGTEPPSPESAQAQPQPAEPTAAEPTPEERIAARRKQRQAQAKKAAEGENLTQDWQDSRAQQEALGQFHDQAQAAAQTAQPFARVGTASEPTPTIIGESYGPSSHEQILQSAITKASQGRTFDLTSEERIALHHAGPAVDLSLETSRARDSAADTRMRDPSTMTPLDWAEAKLQNGRSFESLQPDEREAFARANNMGTDEAVSKMGEPDFRKSAIDVMRTRRRGQAGSVTRDAALMMGVGAAIAAGGLAFLNPDDRKKAMAGLALLGMTEGRIPADMFRKVNPEFGASTIKNVDGSLAELYHGGAGMEHGLPSEGSGRFGKGLYMSESPKRASGYAGKEGSAVYPVYANIRNPITADAYAERFGMGHKTPEQAAAITKILMGEGYDGVVDRQGGKVWEAVAFNPKEQVKSSISNIDPDHQESAREAQAPESVIPKSQRGSISEDLQKKILAAGVGAGLAYLVSPQNTTAQVIAGAAAAAFAPRLFNMAAIKEAFSTDKRIRADQNLDAYETAIEMDNLNRSVLLNKIMNAVPDLERRKAIVAWLEGGKVPLSAAEHDTALQIRKYYNEMRDRAVTAGVMDGGRENYVTHIWDFGKNKSLLQSRGLTTTSAFAKARTITSIAEGKALGLTPLTEDPALLVDIYGRSMSAAIAGKTLVNALKDLKDASGRNLVQGSESAPRDYVAVNIPSMRGNLVHPDVAPSLRMLEPVDLGPITKAFSGVTQALKRSEIAGSLFHAKALIDAAITASNRPDKMLAKAYRLAANKDQMLKDLSNGVWGRDVEAAVRHGVKFRIGKASPAVEDIGGSFYSFADSVQKALDDVNPILGKGAEKVIKINHTLDEVTFTRLHTGLKLTVFSDKYHQLMENGVPEDRAGKIASSYVNDLFGGLNWRRMAEGARTRIGRDIALAMLHPKTRAAMQMLMFAPDWTLSTVRNVTKAFKVEEHTPTGILKEVFNGIRKPMTIGDLHRQTLLRSAVYMLLVGNTINMMMSGHPMWSSEQKDKLSIDLGDGRTVDFARHITEPLRWLQRPGVTLGGKLGYIPQELYSFASGREYIGPQAPLRTETIASHMLTHALPFAGQNSLQGGPVEALMGVLGLPIHGYTDEQKQAMKDERAAERERRKEEESDDN